MIKKLFSLNYLIFFLFLVVNLFFAQEKNNLKIYEEENFYQESLSKEFVSKNKIVNKTILNSNKKNALSSSKTVSSIDLNGPMPGVNHEVMVNAAGTIYPPCTYNTEIITSTGTATTARITFSTNTSGTPTGVPNTANEFFFIYNTTGTNLGNYQISTTSATTYDIVVGTNTFRISHATAYIFDITEVFGQPMLVDNLETLLRFQYYRHTNPAIGDTRRYAVVSVTDPNNTLSAYTSLTTGSDPIAVDDTNSVVANSAIAVTGNLVTNDTDATSGDTKTISEVHGYTSFVGTAYNTTYGTITVQSNGAYSYTVNVNNPTVRGLKNGVNITDIIAYKVRDNVGNFDYGYLTVTINGVTEPPIATDNTNSVTVGTNTTATGNVVTDDSGLGLDRLDRNSSLFVWESQYTNGAAINGTNRSLGGVTLSFVQNTPAGVGGAGNQTIDFTTNGGHSGYLLFVSDPAVNPAGDNQLTINFSKPITNLAFAISDIDFSQGNSWEDQMRVVGSLSGTTVNYNKQVAGSIVQVGNDTFYGTGSVPPNDAHGNVTISFNSPIDKLEFYYNYGPYATAADPGGQIAGVTDLLWQDDEASGVLEVNGSTSNVGIAVAGTYGTFIIYANGNYTYTLNSSNPAVLALTSGQTLTDSIPYTISDNIPGSGNTATANLIITIGCTPPAIPTISTSSATCSTAGTATVTNYDNSVTYSFSPSGPNVGVGGGINNLTAGTLYTVSATVGGGGCTSNPSNSFSISASLTPSAPVVGAITQPTCSVATGSVALSGLPSSGTWTVTANPGGSTITGTGTSANFTGLSAGTTYSFTVTNSDGCISTASTNAIINPQPVTPSAPVVGAITQPTCSVATGSVALSGLPSSGTWTVTANPGGST
ncbi:VCBS domain-containing protein, partial [Flavobacterium sp. 9AF]|uniref:VCBS domain-containing protein n=1 Tax=Flavobacterium sp. 9AF TaxID=2653142 RepID=UPI001356F65B